MSIDSAIKRTIKYSEKYGGKLTQKQLFERLISSDIYEEKEIKGKVESGKLKVESRKSKVESNRVLKDKIKKAKDLAKLIENKFKDILFLGITGSVAAGYPKENDDIDMMIITKRNKLWITRLKLRLFIIKNKIPHRKFGRKENKDDFCFNLWLDENSLEIDKDKQNLKNGVDLILVKKLINRDKIYEKFILANDWVKKWVATGYYNLVVRSSMLDRRKKIKENIWDKLVNWVMFWIQFWYMKKRIKNEKVGLSQAFFHH